MTCTSVMRIRSLRISWKNCMRRLVLQLKRHMNCRIRCSWRRTTIDLRLTIIYCPNRQRKTPRGIQYAPHTRWLTCQWCLRCPSNCCSWCSTSIRVRLSSIWLPRSWWLIRGGITVSSRSGWRGIVRPPLMRIISMRLGIITVMGRNLIWRKGKILRFIIAILFRKYSRLNHNEFIMIV